MKLAPYESENSWSTSLPGDQVDRGPESSSDESQIAIDIIEAGIVTSQKGGFAEVKVQIAPGTQFLGLGEYLASNHFFKLRMSTDAKKAIIEKYAPIARTDKGTTPKEDHADTFSAAVKASVHLVNGDERIHGDRPADSRELAAGDYDKE